MGGHFEQLLMQVLCVCVCVCVCVYRVVGAGMEGWGDLGQILLYTFLVVGGGGGSWGGGGGGVALFSSSRLSVYVCVCVCGGGVVLNICVRGVS